MIRCLNDFLTKNERYLYPSEKFMKLCTLLLLLGLLVGQYLLFGLMYAFDTPQYEVFSSAVYPLYPVALWLFRCVFGTETGYYLLGIFQNILLAFSLFSFIDFLRRTYRLDAVTTLLMTLLSVTIFIVQKFFTQRGIISSNVLFSEALAMPFYLFFFRYLLEASLHKNFRAFLLSCFFALCVILTRGQLYWVLVPVIITGLRLVSAKGFKILGVLILSCAVIVGTVEGARSIQTSHVSDSQTKSPLGIYLLTTAIYCSDSDDAVLFAEGSGEQRLFEALRPGMDDPARRAAFSYETGSLANRQDNFEIHYDPLQNELRAAYYNITNAGFPVSLRKITTTLIINNLPAYLLHCGQNALVALIRTVAILRTGIDICACLFFAFLMLCCVYFPKKGLLLPEVHFALAGLGCAFLNALIMAPGVFAISRYVFYNMPVLYFCALILLRAIILEWDNIITCKR